MNVSEAEEMAALAHNWREAKEQRDPAAAQAFEDELHARLTRAEIRDFEAADPRTGEPSAAETERLSGVLEEMWDNANARLD